MGVASGATIPSPILAAVAGARSVAPPRGIENTFGATHVRQLKEKLTTDANAQAARPAGATVK